MFDVRDGPTEMYHIASSNHHPHHHRQRYTPTHVHQQKVASKFYTAMTIEVFGM